jgi:acetolactate synthase-1/2/3 large subunit
VIRPYVKRSWQPTRVDMLPTALRQAFATMLGGRPGPVNLDVPFNVFKEEDDVEMLAAGAAAECAAAAHHRKKLRRALIWS